jgi:FkbM family methyltransferase
MRSAIQAGLIRMYQLIKSTGLLSTGPGDWAFRSAYAGYKRFLEAGHLEPLGQFVRPGTSVVDVGANVGFFTLKFAGWVRDGGRVIAIEPEAVNYGRLSRAVAGAGLSHVVDTVQAAATERTGQVGLIVNRLHPGDHRIGDGGVQVPSVTIDDLLAEKGSPPVSLIKIDVQGAESRVLAGAGATLDALRPALFIEVCDDALRMCESSAERLLTDLYDRGYSAYRTTREDILGPMTSSQALMEQRAKSYIDLLFLHGRC